MHHFGAKKAAKYRADVARPRRQAACMRWSGVRWNVQFPNNNIMSPPTVPFMTPRPSFINVKKVKQVGNNK
jgi:hypothetical protein